MEVLGLAVGEGLVFAAANGPAPQNADPKTGCPEGETRLVYQQHDMKLRSALRPLQFFSRLDADKSELSDHNGVCIEVEFDDVNLDGGQ